jgi:hypothetical protein
MAGATPRIQLIGCSVGIRMAHTRAKRPINNVGDRESYPHGHTDDDRCSINHGREKCGNGYRAQANKHRTHRTSRNGVHHRHNEAKKEDAGGRARAEERMVPAVPDDEAVRRASGQDDASSRGYGCMDVTPELRSKHPRRSRLRDMDWYGFHVFHTLLGIAVYSYVASRSACWIMRRA